MPIFERHTPELHDTILCKTIDLSNDGEFECIHIDLYEDGKLDIEVWETKYDRSVQSMVCLTDEERQELVKAIKRYSDE